MKTADQAVACESLLPWSPVKIGWLSGVSRPGTNALSAEQQEFVESLPGKSRWKLRTNFPYGPRASTHRPVSLPVASVVNLARFVAVSLPVRSGRSLEAWRAVRESCELLLLITNSCGSQIASVLERRAPGDTPLRLLSLGPVDWGGKGLEQIRVRGSRDPVRTPLSRKADVVIPGLGHMDYARSPQVRELAHEWTLRQLEEDR